MEEAEPAIEAVHLSKRYGDLLALDDLSFRVQAGEVVGFLGPNGAGKTTTMRILTGFVPPTGGRAAISGHDVLRSPVEARRAVGYLPETPPLYPEMTVTRYVDYVARLYDVPRRERGDAVSRALSRCGLSDVQARVIGELSKGYRQRVGIAQAIVHRPPVLILDEPTVGLDPLQIREIRDLIAELASPASGARGQTVVLSTHLLNEVGAICDRVVLIDRGRVALDAPLDALTEGGRSLEETFARVTSRDDRPIGQPEVAG